MSPSAAITIHRDRLRAILGHHSLKSAMLFGSTARGQDSESSDIDILVEPTEATSLMDLARLKIELEDFLGAKVDIATPGALPDDVAQSIARDLTPLYP